MNFTRLSDQPRPTPRIAVHGPAGTGKTRLIRTFTHPESDAPPAVADPGRVLIVSAESGLLSIRGYGALVAEIGPGTNLIETFRAVHKAAKDGQIDALAIDSLSEIAKISLSNHKATTRDGRAAYGEMGDEMTRILRAIRACPVPSYTIMQTVTVDGTASPLFPGQKLAADATFDFDELLYYQISDEGRQLVCQRTPTIEAKDRSGALSATTTPCLSGIIHTIYGDN